MIDIINARHQSAHADAVYMYDNCGALDLPALDQMIAQGRAITLAPTYVFGPKMLLNDEVLNISKAARAQSHATIASISQYAATYRVEDKLAQETALKPHLASVPISNDGEYLFFDGSHFTLEGSLRLGASLKCAHPELFEPQAPYR